MSTFKVEGVFDITGRGTVLTGVRNGPLRRGQYLYGPRFAFMIRGVEQHASLGRDLLELDTVGVLAGRLPLDLFQAGEEFSTERPDHG